MFWLGIALTVLSALILWWAVRVFWSSLDTLNIRLGICAVAVSFVVAVAGVVLIVLALLMPTPAHAGSVISAGTMFDWPLILSVIVVAAVYVGAGVYARTPSGRTMSTSA